MQYVYFQTPNSICPQVLLYQITSKNEYRNDVENFLLSWFEGGDIPYTPQKLAWRSQRGTLSYSGRGLMEYNEYM